MKRLGTTLGLALLFLGCASSTPNRDPVGERFPTVAGESLAGEDVRLPDAVAGAPAVLLVGYVQNAQFDIDRWLLGFAQAGAGVKVVEVPTIEGLMPGLFANAIDGGMRRGIPREDWPSVVTVYGDADEIVALTGNENPANARVLLLDADGKIVWFHDRGWSAGKLLDLLETASP